MANEAEVKRSTVKITFELEDGTSGDTLHKTRVEYFNLPPEGVVAIEDILTGAMAGFVGLGKAKITAMGRESKLKALMDKAPK